MFSCVFPRVLSASCFLHHHYYYYYHHCYSRFSTSSISFTNDYINTSLFFSSFSHSLPFVVLFFHPFPSPLFHHHEQLHLTTPIIPTNTFSKHTATPPSSFATPITNTFLRPPPPPPPTVTQYCHLPALPPPRLRYLPPTSFLLISPQSTLL